MTINIVRADPAGNITAIVTSAVDPLQYASVSSYILQHRIEGIQQVGFLASPKFGGELRLEMMGGEFCGNALRSVGAYWAKKQNIRKACEIEVEISGAKWPLIVHVDPNESSAFAQMPIPQIAPYHYPKQDYRTHRARWLPSHDMPFGQRRVPEPDSR